MDRGTFDKGMVRHSYCRTRVVAEVMRSVGKSVGELHASGVVHGDLTTSNLILRETHGRMEVVLIDFGLGSVSVSEEDMAVDLYVLERAFASTHPKSEGLVTSSWRKRLMIVCGGAGRVSERV